MSADKSVGPQHPPTKTIPNADFQTVAVPKPTGTAVTPKEAEQ